MTKQYEIICPKCGKPRTVGYAAFKKIQQRNDHTCRLCATKKAFVDKRETEIESEVLVGNCIVRPSKNNERCKSSNTCRYYSICLNIAAKNNWNGFKGEGNAEIHPEVDRIN